MGQQSAAVTAASSAAAPAAAEPTTETEAGTTILSYTTIKPPEKQFSNLQEKQPYADKWICQR